VEPADIDPEDIGTRPEQKREDDRPEGEERERERRGGKKPRFHTTQAPTPTATIESASPTV